MKAVCADLNFTSSTLATMTIFMRSSSQQSIFPEGVAKPFQSHTRKLSGNYVTHGLLFRVSAGHKRGSAAVCDPHPSRPFARYREKKGKRSKKGKNQRAKIREKLKGNN